MSFGGGGFGGFGQTNNNQSSGFGGGGFGANNNTTTNTGFGASTNTGFGQQNTGGGLFGSGSTGTTGGFGSGGGFGSTTNNAFGAAKPGGFGTTASTGGMFGQTAAAAPASTGFGGFGSTQNTTSAFGGGNNTGGGLFGQNKPAFGATPAASNPFGGAAATSSPFGGGTGAFGSPQSTALTTTGAGECQGTGSTPFQPFVEKEPNSSSNQQNAFQSICFQAPYSKFSPEELRLVDYAQGRRYGNSNNQTGAFGASNFGGFGATQPATTGFGANTNTTSTGFGATGTNTGFGANQPASTGFGNNTTGGGLFGNKPAGSLFGAQPAATTGGMFGAPAAQTTGGLFGNAPAAQPAGGGLFGNTAAKSPFSFGNAAPASTGTAFGASTTTGGFGNGGLFGNTQQQQTTTPAFGTQQPAATGGFGNFGSTPQQGGGLFGNNNQQKPATPGLFGSTPAAPATGGLFGGAQPAATTGLFGNSTTTQNTGGGLFGNKPAATGGLFGNTAQQTNTNTGGGLFGGGFGNTQNQQPQQQNGGGLFGGGNNQQKPGGLFGNTTTQQQGGNSLFGNPNPNQAAFGGSMNNNQQQQPQQQAGNSLFGGGNSIFNTSQQIQGNSQSLTASIADNGAFGSASLFSNLQSTVVNNPGPLATPLSSSVKAKKTTALPLYKLNSSSASRFTTPQKRPGFGFSYSNYNTPSSASSTSSTPGGAFGNTLLGAGTFGRTLNKSMSTSSLRRSFNSEDNILTPGAFSASPGNRHFGSTGSVKKLTITRGLRHDLFSPPNSQPSAVPAAPSGILKKRVSFGEGVNGNRNGSGSNSPLKESSSAAPSSEELGYLRKSLSSKGDKSDASKEPEMEQVPNNQLAVVNEEEAAPEPTRKPVSEADQEPGQYWMKPSKEEISNMNREQRGQVTGFTVGRKGIGSVRFNTPVDLSNIDLDEVMGGIVQLTMRSATVYPNASKKPPVGKGLNVPSLITLENSWPRSSSKAAKDERSSAKFKKHISRLEKVPDTKFVNYDSDTGVWSFTVEHFTTYGFPEDDDEVDASEFGQSTLSAPPDTPTPKTRSTPKSSRMDESFASDSHLTHTDSDPEDTFEFRKKKVLPGAFDEEEYPDENMMVEYDEQNQESFLDERSAGSQSEDGVEEPMDQDDVYQDDESVSIRDQEMAGSFPEAGITAELDNSEDDDEAREFAAETPGAVMRARMRALKSSETPSKKKFAAGDDWANTLQKTVSPQKQDRALLKSMIDIHGNDSRLDAQPAAVPRRVVSDGRGFATSIDLMNSLFGQTRSPVKAKVLAKPKGFEWPYAKRPKTDDHDTSNMEAAERAFHDSMKPRWGPDGTLVYAAPSNLKAFGKSSRRARERDGLLTIQKGGIVSEHRDVRFAKFSNEASADLLMKHKSLAIIDVLHGTPAARLPRTFSFSDFFDEQHATNPAATHEKLVWELASVLFDTVKIPEGLEQVPDVKDRLLKDRVSAFWQQLVKESSKRQVALAKSDEEKAIAALAGHKIPEACGHLLDNGDFHLATLVALIGSKDSMKRDMRQQLNDWQKSNMLPEFSQPIRAIYELLSGNACVCAGSKGTADYRMETFEISKRFGLDWRQAFGLRLWYATSSKDPIENAIEDFAQDLAQDKESASPHAWYVEQKVPTLWEDVDRDQREDLLWGLLKLKTFDDSDLEDVLRPENSQLSPLDIRLSWQLSRALTSSGRIPYSDTGSEKADRTTLSFASQLVNEGSWLDAAFVLLHLSNSDARIKSIQDLLAQHAGLIGEEDSQSFMTLKQALKIPAPWIWEAKALYMRSVERNPRGEVECLIHAGSFTEAHRTFAKEVAPKAVVELDYDTLRALLKGFQGKENTIAEWHLGGEIYQDFLELVHSDKKGHAVDDLVLERLLAGLPAVVQESRHPGFMETVAIETISGVVAKAVVAIGKNGEKANLHKVLRLPLTEDKYLKHTVELSLEYYRGVMASAR